jgi:chromate reductase
MDAPLNVLIFMGSGKNKGAPWEGNEEDPRLGSRVLKLVLAWLAKCRPNYTVEVVDPRVLQLPVLGTPHFYYSGKEGDRAPAILDEIAAKVSAADAYLVVSPEYNHSVPPALSNLMSYFGGSRYAFKPSGTVVYSGGEYGGMRAAMALRPFLSELGCLPVSAITAFPNAKQLITKEGVASEDTLKRLERMIVQLDFWAHAAKLQRAAAKR